MCSKLPLFQGRILDWNLFAMSLEPAEVGVTGSWCILAMILAPVKYLPYGTATRRETEGEGDVF